MGILIWQGLVTPKFSVPPSGETMSQTPKLFRGETTCSRSSITMPSLVAIGFHPPPGRWKTLSFFCLSVTLFVTSSRFWTSEFVRPISPWRCWNTEMILMPDRGRFAVVHPCLTFSDCRQLSASSVQKPQFWANFDFWGAPVPTPYYRWEPNLVCYSWPTADAYVSKFVLIGLFFRSLAAKPPNFCRFLDLGI